MRRQGKQRAMRWAESGARILGAAIVRVSMAGLFLLCGAGFVLADLDKAREPGPADHVPWLRDLYWQTILDRAGSEGAPILIDFTATWCGPCKLLDAMVFNNVKVIAALDDVVPFQVDIDQPRYRELKERFAVQRLPTLIWCDDTGREVDRITGYLAARDFLATIETWREGSDTFLAANARHDSHPENAESLLDLAERCRLRGDDQRAEILYRRLGNLGDGADCLTRARGLLGLADIAGRTGRRNLGRDLALRTAGLLGDCARDRTEGLRRVVECQAALGDTAGMMETWRTLMHLDDRDIAALNGFARAAVQQKTELEAAARAALRAAILSDLDPHMTETLAECYFWQGKYRRAIRWIRKSIEKAPDEVGYSSKLTRFENSLQQDPYGYRGIKR